MTAENVLMWAAALFVAGIAGFLWVALIAFFVEQFKGGAK